MPYKKIWKQIPNSPYIISSDGEIQNYKTKKFVKEWYYWNKKKGYKTVNLSIDKKIKTFLVHRLVAQMFIPNLYEKPQVNHINGIKTDNRVENLEWVTISENIKHSYNIGLRSKKGEKHHLSKLNDNSVRKIKEMCKLGKNQTEIAKVFNVGQWEISKIYRGHRWEHVK